MNDESSFIKRLKRRENAAFRELIVEYESFVRATVVNMVGHCEEAEDIIQDVFIRFFRSVDNFKGESKLSTYITKIAMNLSLNEIKRRGKRVMMSIEQTPAIVSQLQGDDTRNHFENKELVHKSLLRLDESYRSVVVLRIIQGYSTRETAKMLNLPEGTILSRLARGQKKLHGIMTEMLGVEHG